MGTEDQLGVEVSRLCKEFVNGGTCPRGQTCKYVHPSPGDISGARVRWLAARKRSKQIRRHELGDPHAFDASKKSDRAAVLARWLVQTYGHEQLNKGSGVLDIAGGRGELSFELQHVHKVEVTLVEPRHWKAWKLSKRQRGILKAAGVPWEEFSITQVEAHLTDQMPAHLAQMVQECSLLVGLHPDQATEPILQLAKRFQKPFCILPCCVFPLQHPGRKVIRQDGSHAPVLNYDDLVLYISQAGRARTAALAFAGRNIAVYRVTGTEQATCGMQNFSCA